MRWLMCAAALVAMISVSSGTGDYYKKRTSDYYKKSGGDGSSGSDSDSGSDKASHSLASLFKKYGGKSGSSGSGSDSSDGASDGYNNKWWYLAKDVKLDDDDKEGYFWSKCANRIRDHDNDKDDDKEWWEELGDKLNDYATMDCTCVEKNPCDKGPCQNGGTCTKLTPLSYSCACPGGFSGKDCGHDACGENPCENGGTCQRNSVGGGYACSCTIDYDGTNCGQRDPCATNPCKNAGTCTRSGSQYACACAGGYCGRNCDQDACNPNPCKHGNCQRGSSGCEYACLCDDGFSGKNCDEIVCPTYDTSNYAVWPSKNAALDGKSAEQFNGYRLGALTKSDIYKFSRLRFNSLKEEDWCSPRLWRYIAHQWRTRVLPGRDNNFLSRCRHSFPRSCDGGVNSTEISFTAKENRYCRVCSGASSEEECIMQGKWEECADGEDGCVMNILHNSDCSHKYYRRCGHMKDCGWHDKDYLLQDQKSCVPATCGEGLECEQWGCVTNMNGAEYAPNPVYFYNSTNNGRFEKCRCDGWCWEENYGVSKNPDYNLPCCYGNCVGDCRQAYIDTRSAQMETKFCAVYGYPTTTTTMMMMGGAD